MSSITLAALIAVATAGFAITLQAPINAALGRNLGSTLGAASVSFFVGFSLLLALSFLRGEAGAFMRLAATPRWMLVGGALGAFYVWAALWSIPILGALTTASMLILGQMIAALAIDHFGLIGLPVREISLPRLAAAGLVAAGLVLSRF
ncbi:DMT family transporter [Pontibaca salina]|uniref:DMT family transporter n=1 Tax=Pontibaca salina TaxID=2795731 RepID=A0A934HTZ5_9RHOB|nr:DMT family transporter [Pontibaca salina]MBI6630495.1 DMT family transporter [Pontibaca salina]